MCRALDNKNRVVTCARRARPLFEPIRGSLPFSPSRARLRPRTNGEEEEGKITLEKIASYKASDRFTALKAFGALKTE